MTTIVPSAWCPTCRQSAPHWDTGPGKRPDASCVHCNSLERHRLVALVLDWLAPLLDDGGLVVEAAPTPSVRRMLIERVGRRRYLAFDLGLDARQVDLYADITQLPFADRSIRVLVCFHVLEHVPDDRAAMSEIARVVTDDGITLVMNPWVRHVATAEDPDASPEERTRRFGQSDHVRLYGNDFEDRLRAAGLHVHRFEPSLVLPVDLVARANLGEIPLWILTCDGPAGAPVREQLASLLPPGDAPSRSLAATAVAPVMVAAEGEQQLQEAHDILGGADGLVLARDAGLLDEVRRLARVLHDTAGLRKAIVSDQLARFDQVVRRQLDVASRDRWGEVLTGLTSNSGQQLVDLILRTYPDAQLIHVADQSKPPSPSAAALRSLGLRAGLRRYLEIDTGALDVTAVHRQVTAFIRPSDAPGHDDPDRADEDLQVEHG